MDIGIIAGQILRDLAALEDDQRYQGTAIDELSHFSRKHLYLSCILTRLQPSETGLRQVSEDFDHARRI